MTIPHLVRQIDDAIQAHQGMSKALYLAIATETLTQPSHELACDDRCAFGRWLKSAMIPPEARASKAYAVITRLHAEFHRTAGEVARIYETGEHFEAYTLLDGEYTRAGETLVRAMEKWRAQELRARELEKA